MTKFSSTDSLLYQGVARNGSVPMLVTHVDRDGPVLLFPEIGLDGVDRGLRHAESLFLRDPESQMHATWKIGPVSQFVVAAWFWGDGWKHQEGLSITMPVGPVNSAGERLSYAVFSAANMSRATAERLADEASRRVGVAQPLVTLLPALRDILQEARIYRCRRYGPSLEVRSDDE